MKLVVIGYGFSSRAIVHDIGHHFSSIDVTTRSVERADEIQRKTQFPHLYSRLFNSERTAPELIKNLAHATHLLISAPPDETGDPTLRLLRDGLQNAEHLQRVFYLSTVGVYGDHQGQWVDETTPLRPVSIRSRQRVDAEMAWEKWAAARGCDLGIFRLSGIYGPGRSAIENMQAGTARRIVKPDQVFNRIHVEDIAGSIRAALAHAGALGIVNVTDCEPAPPQDVVAYAAHLMDLPVPPDIPFESANLSPMGRSFYGENKRVSNQKLREILGYSFRYPSYREGLTQIFRRQSS